MLERLSNLLKVKQLVCGGAKIQTWRVAPETMLFGNCTTPKNIGILFKRESIMTQFNLLQDKDDPG